MVVEKGGLDVSGTLATRNERIGRRGRGRRRKRMATGRADRERWRGGRVNLRERR